MTPDDWDRLQSWRRHCVEPSVCLRVFRTLSVLELWAAAVAVAVGAYATYLQPRPDWPDLVSKDNMIVFTLTSFALALLMVFRTNTAHVRRSVHGEGEGLLHCCFS
jgi:predicted membrane chloride channel (bestrophin family)